MKAAPLLVTWHEENAPIYSAHYEPHGKGRLATAGGDHRVRLWKVEAEGEDRKITFLSTLAKHTQAVNVVRWCPRGELLASAGDDGNVLLWVPSDTPALSVDPELHENDVEHWRVKTMCRSNSGLEIYDLAWSPDGTFFITGSMDNVARIYNASTGTQIRQIAEHNNYVQGVAWDPLNEYVATQSSDRSVRIYQLKTKDGQFSLNAHNKVIKMDLPGRRISSNSPAPPDFGSHRASFVQEAMSEAAGSPKMSAPGTPQSLALPMNPPPTSHSRRSSFGSQMGQSVRRSVSPSPSMPLPAVMPSASPSVTGSIGLGVRNANLYANDTFTSFFRRLTFAPDGSLLFTPAGQFKTSHQSGPEVADTTDEISNTVYIYTRGGLNKPPVAYLPGHKKPSVAVKCSPIYYTIRAPVETREITIDSRSADDIPPLPEPAVPSKAPTSHAAMDPPPLTSAPSPSPSHAAAAASPRNPMDPEKSPSLSGPPPGPPPTFNLGYRMVYGVATQDSVYIYDTQQQKPLCVVSNLHYATFTDLTWSSDGLTLVMTSSDGFCSALTFTAGELGTVYHPPTVRQTPTPINVPAASSTTSTPAQTPTTSTAPLSAPQLPALPRPTLSQTPSVAISIPAGSPYTPSMRPASPARSMSASSIATEASFARAPDQNAPPMMNNPTPSMGSVPSVAAAGSNLPLFTPPQTPGHGSGNSISGAAAGIKRPSDASETAVAGVKRPSDSGDGAPEAGQKEKKRRIAPTPVTDGNGTAVNPPPPPPPPPPAAPPAGT